jgi:hypothetical protein
LHEPMHHQLIVKVMIPLQCWCCLTNQMIV